MPNENKKRHDRVLFLKSTCVLFFISLRGSEQNVIGNKKTAINTHYYFDAKNREYKVTK